MYVIAEARREPFSHATAIQVISEALANRALDWLETKAAWSLTVADFYEQWETTLDLASVPESITPLIQRETVCALAQMMFSSLTRARLEIVEITAHKLVAGQTIRIHNDYLKGFESHRLLLQLNRGWNDSQGGHLFLFGSAEPEDVRRIIRPIHRSAVSFVISPESFHAVSPVCGGERYTVVYSYKARANGLDNEG